MFFYTVLKLLFWQCPVGIGSNRCLNKESFALQTNDMTEVRTFTKTEIIHDDKIGCTEEFSEFSKQLLQSQFNVEYDYVTFRCYTKIDDKNIRHTKIYKEVKIPVTELKT
jgi:hypothetical protein